MPPAAATLKQMSTPPRPVDVAGNPIAVGMAVQIPRIPAWLIHDLPADDASRILCVAGRVLRVSEIDAHGYVWVASGDGGSWFCVRPDELVVVALPGG